MKALLPRLPRAFRDSAQGASHSFEIARRAIVGTWEDGFIHAGNLAYMAIFAIFPFFIAAAAVLGAITDRYDRLILIDMVLAGLPPRVVAAIRPVAIEVIEARSGWLIWLGAAVGIWAVGSLIESIREIVRRAYRARPEGSFIKHRLRASAIAIAAILVLITSLIAQIALGAVQQWLHARLPQIDGLHANLWLSQAIAALGAFLSSLALFAALTPRDYRGARFPKWPGALATTLWWVAINLALPPAIRSVFTYDLTYGALSGIMIALFFFYLVGLGVVFGAEINGAIARTSGAPKRAGGD